MNKKKHFRWIIQAVNILNEILKGNLNVYDNDDDDNGGFFISTWNKYFFSSSIYLYDNVFVHMLFGM